MNMGIQRVNLRAISLEDSNHIHIQIHRGVGSRALPYEVMGLTSKEARERNITPPTIKLFPELQKAANKLNTIKAGIYRLTIPSTAFRVYHNENKEAINERLETLEFAKHEGLILIEDCYQSNFDSLPDRVEFALEKYIEKYTVDLNIDKKTIISRYIARFPTLEQVKDSFGYDAFIGDVQGLLSAATQDTNLETRLIDAIQQGTSSRIEQGVSDSIKEIESTMIQRMSDLLSEIKSLGPEDKPSGIKTELREVVDQIRAYAPFVQGLDDLQELMSSSDTAMNRISSVARPSTDLLKEVLAPVEDRLNSVKDTIKVLEANHSDSMFFGV